MCDSPPHEEDQNVNKEPKETSKIINSIHCHSFASDSETEQSDDFSKESAVLNQSIQKNGESPPLNIIISDTSSGNVTRNLSETCLSTLSSKSIYFIPVSNKFSASVFSSDNCCKVSNFANVTTVDEVESLNTDICHFLDCHPAQFTLEGKHLYNTNIKENKQTHNVNTEEKATTIALQVLIPYLIAGIGTCGAGLLLDMLQYWTVFQNVSELFIVVTPLLGLKGNLEMTLASRLSTQAQSTVMGFIAAIFAIAYNAADFNYKHALLLCCSSLGTATLTTIGLGVVTTATVVISHRININPDNIATPIVASLGDLTTLGVFALISSKLYEIKELIAIPSVIIAILLILVPFWIHCAKKNIYVHRLILTGWLSVIIAVVITSGGGLILEKALKNFEGMAVFQPVINGIGGNLVAVQASRITTYFHQRSKLGKLVNNSNKPCISPSDAFFGKNDHSLTARILMLLVVPGHLIFIYSIHWIKDGNTSLSFIFTLIYLSAALLQVAILLYIAHCMILWMWRLKIDPDNSAIPFLTALGDLFGTGLLAVSFLVFQLVQTSADIITLPTLPSNATYSLLPLIID